MRSTLLTLVIATQLVACATSPRAPAATGLAGIWGEDPADCQGNPHTLSFSADGDTLLLRYPEGGTADGKALQDQFTYRVLEARATGLHVSLDGEARTDASGRPVTWEIRQTSADSYCWWRSDWAQGDCTQARMRCEP